MLRVAILDLYNGTENKGIPAIKNLLEESLMVQSYEIFDVRAKNEMPSLGYDLYISSGGPGHPLEGDGIWDVKYYSFIDDLIAHNKSSEDKKYLFLICYIGSNLVCV